jgi:hypothetical protein
LNEANGQEDPVVALSPERLRALQARLSKHRCNLSVHHRHRLNRVSRKKADSARPPNLDRLVAPRTLLSKGGVKLSELSVVVGHHRQPAPSVRVAPARSEGNRATANLARHLVLQVLARREAEKSVGNLARLNLQPHRLAVQVRAKREADEREGKAHMVNLPGNQEAERRLGLSKVR